ncbi:MAG: competence/damage-inducible protein A [Clostridiales bacterium]|nr:competence/damage-inducible protein A [Clostridiales bacterium]
MKAEIISIGTEILLGDIVNTNAQYIAKQLAHTGIFVYHQTVVGDNGGRLMEAYKTAFERVDLVITTGGLGPTRDDISKEVAAEYFNKELVLDEDSLKSIEKYVSMTNRKMSEGNKKQAYFPKDAIIIKNNNGTAPGCIIEDNGKTLILLPGPPREMIPMFENDVLPFLRKYQDGVLVSKVLKICGIGESDMEEKIKDIVENQTNPTIAPYSKTGELILRITAKAKDKKEAEKLIKPVEKKIRKRLGDYIYGEGDTSLEEEVAKILIKNKLTISTAESCTGGLLSARLINYPGISSVYKEGVITYSNESKEKLLGVKKDTLEKYGAVSRETAMEMAEGIAKISNTNIGVSITGIAGPDGGAKEKPVGLVYLGLFINGELKSRELFLKGDRQKIRNYSVSHALCWIRRELTCTKRTFPL